MLSRLPRRKRQVLIASLLSAVVIVATTAAVLLTSGAEAPYRPGEEIDGITSALDRELPEAYTPIAFVDASDEAGIAFMHFAGTRSSQLPEDMGSGAAWGDFDNDGWPDLFVANWAGPLTLSPEERDQSPARCALYRNNGDGTFTEVSRAAGVDYLGGANGAAWGDYDQDGWIDLIITAYGDLRLYRNRGDGTFEDASDAAGVGRYQRYWSGASWGDYNRDGYPDVYVTGYVQYRRPDSQATARQYDVENPASINPSAFAPEANLLLKNNGDGTLSEVALISGVANAEGRSLSAAWVDVDDDGWSDLYVANDVSDNVLYRNLGNGAFEDISHAAWVADYRGAMGLAVGDWDGDTDMDMAVTHWIAQENALYSNQLAQDRRAGVVGRVRFMDEADQYGLGQIALDYIGWGTSFMDFDNDGRLDLFVVNGSTLQEKTDPTRLGAMRDQFFWNGGPRNGFYDVSPASGPYFQEQHVGRGAAFADYDRDGDVDAFIVNHGGRGVLLRNDGGNRKSWLAVRLEGRASNQQALGARVRLVAGDRVQVRQVGAQASYLSQNSFAEHFGLGDHARVDTIEVWWPSGIRQVVTQVPAEQQLQLIEPEATP